MNYLKNVLCSSFLIGALVLPLPTPGLFDGLFGKPKPPEFTASEILEEKIFDQSVFIMILGKGMGNCSGTLIHKDDDKSYVLTAKHCIDVTEEMYVEHEKVSYVITSVKDDLALLVVDGDIPDKKVSLLGVFNPYRDDIVHHIGFPSGVIYKASGTISRFTDDWMYLDFQVIAGCSGGGIFDEDGDLVGVVWGAYNNPKVEAPLKSVAESLRDVKAFLNTIGYEQIIKNSIKRND